jgi:tRNA pseudouridine13 synthase
MPDGPLGEVVRDVLQPFDLEWNNLRVKHLKDVFLSKGSRPGLIFPRDMESTLRDDELHPRRKAIHLAFSLGKGSYATILVKRVTDIAEPPA